MLAGLERSRATEPIFGVFYIEGIHGGALLVLFGYTVIEVRPVSEGEATSCSNEELSVESARSRVTAFGQKQPPPHGLFQPKKIIIGAETAY